MAEHDPTLMAFTRLAIANDHGELGTPESLENLLRAQMLASIETCDHCDVIGAVTPVACQRWAVDLVHDSRCRSMDV